MILNYKHQYHSGAEIFCISQVFPYLLNLTMRDFQAIVGVDYLVVTFSRIILTVKTGSVNRAATAIAGYAAQLPRNPFSEVLA